MFAGRAIPAAKPSFNLPLRTSAIAKRPLAGENVLFERFIRVKREEPPDIDINFEHQRREEGRQCIFRKYGRDRAAITGVVTSYRTKSALRDVGKALGFPLETVERLAKTAYGNEEQWMTGCNARFAGCVASWNEVRRLRIGLRPLLRRRHELRQVRYAPFPIVVEL